MRKAIEKMEETKKIGTDILETLYENRKKIENIISNNNKISNNLDTSNSILKKMSSFFNKLL